MTFDLVKQFLKYTIFLGLIGMFIAWAFGLHSAFTQEITINGQTMLTFSWQKYINTLTDAWSTNALNFEDILPSRTWQEANFNFWNQNEFWGAIINNIAFVFDWMYFPINFIAYITRWMAWIFRLALALIGWDFTMTNGIYNSSLVRSMTWITQYLMIPYV